jgi:hypothetical protein
MSSNAHAPPPQRPPRRLTLAVSRVLGIALLVASLYPYWECLRTLDRRDYVSAMLAGFIGWFLTQAGVELVRPETAE